MNRIYNQSQRVFRGFRNDVGGEVIRNRRNSVAAIRRLICSLSVVATTRTVTEVTVLSTEGLVLSNELNKAGIQFVDTPENNYDISDVAKYLLGDVG